MKVVFTGAALDLTGKNITREDLIAACQIKGIVVQRCIKPSTELLVASRVDTVKAKGAIARGLMVIGYPAFIAEHLKGDPTPTDAKPNFWTDKIAKAMQVPDFTAEYGLSLEHIL